MAKARFALIHQARAKAGLSLRDVASRTGIDFTRLAKIEHGTRPAPGLSEIRTLADLLHLDMGDLLVAAGTSREVMEHLTWSERLYMATFEPTLPPVRVKAPPLHAKNLFSVEVEERDGALCQVALGEGSLTVLSFSPAESLRIEIPPQGILVLPKALSSALKGLENVLSARVKKIRHFGQLANLILSGRGFELNALHTRRQLQAMRLKEGDRVSVVIPAAVVQTVPIEERT